MVEVEPTVILIILCCVTPALSHNILKLVRATPCILYSIVHVSPTAGGFVSQAIIPLLIS